MFFEAKIGSNLKPHHHNQVKLVHIYDSHCRFYFCFDSTKCYFLPRLEFEYTFILFQSQKTRKFFFRQFEKDKKNLISNQSTKRYTFYGVTQNPMVFSNAEEECDNLDCEDLEDGIIGIFGRGTNHYKIIWTNLRVAASFEIIY